MTGNAPGLIGTGSPNGPDSIPQGDGESHGSNHDNNAGGISQSLEHSPINGNGKDTSGKGGNNSGGYDVEAQCYV